MNNYTFKTLIGSKQEVTSPDGKKKCLSITRIEIPRIQRDYAQGRKTKDVEKIRNSFLSSLYSALSEDREITLDFVYGDVYEEKGAEDDENKHGVLTLLDGQQRLTTLYLLYWYLSRKESVPSSESEFLKHFSYDTRPSARDFCKELCKFDCNPKSLPVEMRISDMLSNQSWFEIAWEYDPTVDGMLVMLDAIHSKFFECGEELWSRAVSKINFNFLPLYKMGLSDELYIKMNSRGKSLTQFEHLKAYIEKTVEEYDAELSREVGLDFDKKWANIFFLYRDKNDTADDEMLMFFRFVSKVICYEQNIDILKSDDFDIVDKVYSEQNVKGKGNLLRLKAAFDCLSVHKNLDAFFESYFTSDTYQSGKVKLFSDINLFKRCCDSENECTLNEFILFYCVILYWQNEDKITKDDFLFRIRIIRNLIKNSSDEIRSSKMKGILATSKEIIFDESINGDSENYNSFQKQEERGKIDWLKDPNNDQYKEDLLELESDFLLHGSIRVIGLENRDNFKNYLQLSKALESGCVKYDSLNRVLLSFMDYSQKIGDYYQLGSQTQQKTWEDMLHISSRRTGFEETKTVMNLLLSQVAVFNEENLNAVVDKYLELEDLVFDWRYYFIKYECMRSGNFGMYYWFNGREQKPYEVIMMNTAHKISGYNWEVFSYYFFNTYPDVFKLNNYANNGDKLVMKETGYTVDFRNSSVVVLDEDAEIGFMGIPQSNGIDTQDRIPLIKDFLSKWVTF